MKCSDVANWQKEHSFAPASHCTHHLFLVVVTLFLKDFLFPLNFFLHRVATWQDSKAGGGGRFMGNG